MRCRVVKSMKQDLVMKGFACEAGCRGLRLEADSAQQASIGNLSQGRTRSAAQATCKIPAQPMIV